jgi:hypothetical protein
MMARFALLCLPMVAFGQQAAEVNVPPAAERELRARVSAFYQNFVDGSPRKAESFVAEDTKDYYYGAAKMHFESFQIGKITFSDSFTKAVVVVVGKTYRHIGAQSVLMDVPQDTHWKIEEGEWRWYYHQEDYALTPMSEKNPPAGQGGIAPPVNTSPEELKKMGQGLLKEEQPMGLDKNTVSLPLDKKSSTKLVFTNDSRSYVQVAVNGPIVRGLTLTFEPSNVPGQGKSVLNITYDPLDKSGPADAWTPKGKISFQVIAFPLYKAFPLTIDFPGTN